MSYISQVRNVATVLNCSSRPYQFPGVICQLTRFIFKINILKCLDSCAIDLDNIYVRARPVSHFRQEALMSKLTSEPLQLQQKIMAWTRGMICSAEKLPVLNFLS
jgi:hypothetical protein